LYRLPRRRFCANFHVVVDKVVEEDHRLLHANELEPITLLDGITQTLRRAARNTFAIFNDFDIMGNGERPQFLQL
jgi:hypothetical protein